MFFKLQLIINGNSEQFNLSGVVNRFSINIYNTKEVFCLSPRIINWNLLGFAFRELAWNQLSRFSRSYLRFEKIMSNFLSKLYNVLSPAKLQTSDFIKLRNKSLINVLKRDANVYVRPRTEGWFYLSP